jgi:ubiquitin thioesterase otulin
LDNDNRSPAKSQPTTKRDLNNSGSGNVQNISPRYSLEEYVSREWKGSTANANVMRKGYKGIPGKVGFHHLRRIRGDNYCALRATLYQVLVHRLPLAEAIGSLQEVTKLLEVFRDRQYVYLQNWSFGGRLTTRSGQVYDQVLQCVQCLYQQIEAVLNQNSEEAREKYVSSLLNSSEETDIRLMEAVKVLLMLKTLSLYEASNSGKEVPVFVWLLFARDSSPDPEKFFINHLNCVGDSGGLEQVEMFLLAYTLGVGIQVVRPSAWGKEDFVTCYKEEGDSQSPLVHLIAEDDRHYNVLLS